MKIKLLKGIVVNAIPCQKGAEVEVAGSLGQRLIANGHAVKVLELPKVVPKPTAKPKRKKPIKED